MTYGVPRDALDIIGQLRTGLAARPVSAAGLAAIYRYRDADEVRRNLDALATARSATSYGRHATYWPPARAR